MSDLPAFFQSIELPALPAPAQALVLSLDQEEAALAPLRGLLAADAARSARVLRAATHLAPQGTPPMDTLDAAFAALGPAPLRTLAIADCLYQVCPVPGGLDRAEFWRHSTVCAGYARWLAGGIGLDPQPAWLAGLMLRLGELLIGQAQPQTLAEIERAPLRPGERWARELQLLGFTEGQVSAELAHRWHFPAAMVRGLNTACAPLAHLPLSQLGGVLHLASLLADTPPDDPAIVETLPLPVISMLDLNLDWLRAQLPARERFPDLPFPDLPFPEPAPPA